MQRKTKKQKKDTKHNAKHRCSDVQYRPISYIKHRITIKHSTMTIEHEKITH